MESDKMAKLGKALIFAVIFVIVVFVSIGCTSAATYTVCFPGCNYTSIRAAINVAEPGDTIEVHSGTYYENVDVTKQLILKGVDTSSGKPVVDASGSNNAITLSAGGITLDGFTVTNSGSSREDADAGIRVTSNNNIITGNNVSNNNGSGIYLNSSCSNNNIITGNNFSNNNGSGIYLNSCGNNITGNTFVNDGLFVTNNSYQNTVKNNIVNGKPLIYLEQASDFEVTAAGQVILVNCNNITVENLDLSNTCVGVELLGTEDSIISNNTLSNNRVGICLGYSCNNNNITGNTASNNLIHGIVLENSSNSNNIIGNSANNNYGGGIVLMDSCNNNNITGNTASNNWAGIVLGYSCNNNNIIGNNASYNNCGGIVLGYSCNNNNITDNNASYNNCNGIEFTDSNNNNITGNNVSNNNGPGIGLFYFSKSNTITGNTFVNGGLYVSNSYQNTVEENIVNGKPLIYLEDASDFEVTDAGQVILVNCNNITVDNLDLSNTSVGVELLETEDSIISNNTLSSNEIGIGLGYSNNNNTLRGNNVRYNDNGYGIWLNDSCNNTIAGNTASNNFGGIDLRSSSNNNIITGNNVSNNVDGIYLNDSCNNNNITGNNVRYNSDDGIDLWSSCNNTITGNNVSNNDDGIVLLSSCNSIITGNNVRYNNDSINFWSSCNNKIYLNNFINNTNNVYSYNSTNIWNSTEAITYQYNDIEYTNYLGNYWSDYKEKYPEAEEINGYGIWGTQYSIEADRDKYPLIQPCENYFAPAPSVFDTGTGTYPSLMGTHKGTIKPSSIINVSKLYTYPCVGTGGHTESIKLEKNGILIANGTWDGYHEDWHNITLHNVTDGTHYVTLLQDHEYNYTIRTGSYPQILHAASKEVTGGTITCTSFVDANGKTYTDWIPAIKFFW